MPSRAVPTTQEPGNQAPDSMLGVTGRSSHLDAGLQDYLMAHSTAPDDVLSSLAAETARLFPDPSGMQIGADQGTLMTLLTRLAGATAAVEVGTFTGYSSICIARGLAAGGRLVCCDVSDEWTSVARRYWKLAGLDDRIELRLGPAIGTLRALPPGPHLDLAFLDADKRGYTGYWEELVPRLRPGGLILADNTLRGGTVADPAEGGEAVTVMREFNDHVTADQRVDQVLLPVGDGLTLARRR
jgi:caffeoyl-CoA O-methyltransferase